MKEPDNIQEDTWVALILENGEHALGRTFICPTRKKIRIRFIGENPGGGLLYLSEVNAIAPLELVWEEVYVEQSNEENI